MQINKRPTSKKMFTPSPEAKKADSSVLHELKEVPVGNIGFEETPSSPMATVKPSDMVTDDVPDDTSMQSSITSKEW